MNWKEVGKKIAKAAPMLGTALGGPMGGALGGIVASAFGVENDPTAVMQAINKDPEILVKLKDIELKNEQHLRDHLFRMTEAELKGVADARNLQVEALKQDDKFSKRFLYYLTIFWSVAAAFYVGFITFGEIPENNIRFADTCLGFVLGTIVAGMFQYFYGSTLGSRSKTVMQDDTVKELISTLKNG